MPTSKLPLYRYTIDLRTDDPDKPAQRTVDATQFGQEGSWFIFDGVESTVLTIRQELVIAVERSKEPVGSQEVEAL